MKKSLGLVEIAGMSTAILAADAMAKAANVTLLELENAKGGGYMTIKVLGDVGAVKAAVDVGKQIGIMNNKLVSFKVIARPADAVEGFFCSTTKETIIEAVIEEVAVEEAAVEIPVAEKAVASEAVTIEIVADEKAVAKEVAVEEVAVTEEAVAVEEVAVTEEAVAEDETLEEVEDEALSDTTGDKPTPARKRSRKKT